MLYVCFMQFMFFVLVFPFIVSAATLFVSGSSRNAILNEEFSVDIELTTLGELVNAVEGSIWYERDMLNLENIREDNSAIGLWVTRPERTEEGVVRFSGVIPGGSPSARTHILTLIFRSLKAGNTRVWLQDARAFLNDGRGTSVPLSFEEYRVSIREQIPDSLRVPERVASSTPLVAEDREPPIPFQPALGHDESVFEGKWFLSFSATDKMSGIEHYEIYEGPKIQKSEILVWQQVESPYLIIDQTLQSYIYIRAYDRAGNYRTEIVEPQKKESSSTLWIVGAVIVILGSVVWKYKKNLKLFIL